MSENLIKKPLENNNNEKPQIPEKFFDKEKKIIKTDELLKSYFELEKMINKMIKIPSEEASEEEVLSFRSQLGVPEKPEDYPISIKNSLLASDNEVNAKLHKAGFTKEQAQLVYDLAEERVLPVIERLAADFEANKQIEKLVTHFGGEEKWNEISRQISVWAKKNISPDIYEALASTHEGVLTMYKMMLSKEPEIGTGKSEGFENLSLEKLREMMKDPKYWRDQETSYVEKIKNGFEKLYPQS
jgi:hypothetical protein